MASVRLIDHQAISRGSLSRRPGTHAAMPVLTIRGGSISALLRCAVRMSLGLIFCVALMLPAPLLADPQVCTPGGPNTVNCEGNQSAGVTTADVGSASTINVQNLTNPIAPLSGTPGISLTSTAGVGATPTPFTLNFDPVGTAQSLTTNAAAGISISVNGFASPDDSTTGGAGSDLTLTIQPGPITATGATSAGILAITQGGVGHGGSNGTNSGGDGSGGGDGGIIISTNNSAITTTGDASPGISLESFGGNAGGGGSTTGAGNSGSGGAGGAGGDITLTNTGNITTNATANGVSNAIQVLSIGGNGANSGTSETGNAGIGGNIIVMNSGVIVTSSPSSNGIFAESASGGAGAGGHSDSGHTGGDGAPGALAGTVQVTNTNAITTNGVFSNGIEA